MKTTNHEARQAIRNAKTADGHALWTGYCGHDKNEAAERVVAGESAEAIAAEIDAEAQMTNEQAQHTPGALRAADLVMTLLKWPEVDRDAYRESVAQLIDNETAAPELLAALRAVQQAVDTYNADKSGSMTFADYFFSYKCDGIVNRAIAKARGEVQSLLAVKHIVRKHQLCARGNVMTLQEANREANRYERTLGEFMAIYQHRVRGDLVVVQLNKIMPDEWKPIARRGALGRARMIWLPKASKAEDQQ